MKFKLIYPKWPKLSRQTEFHLPPHGPVVFAATVPDDVEIEFIDENLEPIDFDDPVDFVGISMMLTLQVKRGWQIADIYRARGVKVIFGGIATMLHAEETMTHADSVFIGEAEGRMEKVFRDFKKGAAATGIRLFGGPGPHQDRRHRPARYSEKRPVQLQGHSNGRSGARLTRVPLSLLSLRGGLSGR